ncbi:hypothetical protein LOZ80_26315 [Paenibacillus sp. HWE-109]|uniref:hypothetical protein n=1 Tax=Paenibacillus sp. HWE-109 TaxID=1306526 RepID=UPI001EDFBE0D|nr:hypothetical protein [Paenibacillus sp. HWE-109]UKS25090.1 hypothetical protein LOZ80_26315 [Paenibacillus sp. HWE-109]
MSHTLKEEITDDKLYLIDHALADMDVYYDADMQLLWDKDDPDRHYTRGSAHYALGLLIRDNPGDFERACDVITKVMDMQYDCPEEIYHGTFRTSPQDPPPPLGNYPWKTFAPGFAYFLDSSLDKISNQLSNLLPEHAVIKQHFQTAVQQVLPTVWKSYDPNWREFIACTFAVILAHFEQQLPTNLVTRMDDCMVKAVGASIDRRLSDTIPMNSNIELMHIFICDYYGHHFNRPDWITHAELEGRKFYDAFKEFGTFAEFNTTTYYGVDLTVLGLWRTYGESLDLKRIGLEMEHELWANIALFYNPNLENLSGPFARAYDMDMRAHSSIGVFIYLALGEGYEYLADINCESEHDPMIALVGVDVPEVIRTALRTYQGNRLAVKSFRELCERNDPRNNMNLCIASAWIEEKLMIGAMSGSRNTNGQMHPATIHWMTDGKEKYDLRLIRREQGGSWNSHLRGITFEAQIKGKQLVIEVSLDTQVDIEVIFEVRGQGLSSEMVKPDSWVFPGLTCNVVQDAPVPSVIQAEDRLEIVYLFESQHGSRVMRFLLDLV